MWPWSLVLIVLSLSPGSSRERTFVGVVRGCVALLGVDLVSAPCEAWPGGNCPPPPPKGTDEPRHRTPGEEEWVGGLTIVVLFVFRFVDRLNCVIVLVLIWISSGFLSCSFVRLFCSFVVVVVWPSPFLRTCHEIYSESCPDLSKSYRRRVGCRLRRPSCLLYCRPGYRCFSTLNLQMMFMWPWSLVLIVLSLSPGYSRERTFVGVVRGCVALLGVDLISAIFRVSSVRFDCVEGMSTRHARGHS